MFISNKKKTYTLEDTIYFENKRHKSHEPHCHTAPVQLHCIFKACLKPKIYVLYLAANAGHELPGLPEKNAMLNCASVLLHCCVLYSVCVFPVFTSSKLSNVCKYTYFLFWTQAPVKIRVKGERAPELLLEFRDDDRTQAFLTQVKSAQQQGKSVAVSETTSM